MLKKIKVINLDKFVKDFQEINGCINNESQIQQDLYGNLYEIADEFDLYVNQGCFIKYKGTNTEFKFKFIKENSNYKVFWYESYN